MRRLRWAMLVLLTDLSWCGCWMQRDDPAVPLPQSHRMPRRHRKPKP